jgi:hypothetical protein
VTRKRFVPKTVRVSQDAVTGETVAVPLTPRRLALERVVQCLDRERLRFSNAEAAALVQDVVQACAAMLPHVGGEGGA